MILHSDHEFWKFRKNDRIKPESVIGMGENMQQHWLLSKVIEAELAELLSQYSNLEVEGKQAVVRNGHLSERTVQTGLGDIAVKVPKVRDRSGQSYDYFWCMS